MFERYLIELWNILYELGFPLLLGVTIAGAIHVLLPGGFVLSNLGKKGLASTVKSALIGVPMPLCSCGVIPTAIGLKRDGASDGATTSFLISTPQTGVDSILVNATFLGWPFAIFKLITAFITGIIGGSITDAFDKSEKAGKSAKDITLEFPTSGSKLKEALRFGVRELLGMIYGWIILGILVAALIALLVPPGYLSGISWINGFGGYFLMLLIALPLYVCATASVPIAASLIAAGMAPGTALVFLMAGPATNVATIGAIFRALGGKVLAIYLATVAVFSIAFGWLFDFVITPGKSAAMIHHHGSNLFYTICAVILLGLLGFLVVDDFRKRYFKKHEIELEENMMKFRIKGMTCQHCAANVTKALESVPGVVTVKVSLDDEIAVIDGDADVKEMIESVKKAGYEAKIY
jgi:uncharacterized membrane protein YraQ (UPF0718 family)/copper chaperone CopZ